MPIGLTGSEAITGLEPVLSYNVGKMFDGANGSIITKDEDIQTIRAVEATNSNLTIRFKTSSSTIVNGTTLVSFTSTADERVEIRLTNTGKVVLAVNGGTNDSGKFTLNTAA